MPQQLNPSLFIDETNNQFPITEEDIRWVHPTVTFPTPFKVPDDWSFKPVLMVRPVFDRFTEKLEGRPPVKEDGVWVQRFDVVSRGTPEESAALLNFAKDALKALVEDVLVAKDGEVITTADGGRFKPDLLALTKLALVMAVEPTQSNITTLTLKFVEGRRTISITEARTLVNEIVRRTVDLNERARAHYDAIDLLQTSADIDDYREFQLTQNWE